MQSRFKEYNTPALIVQLDDAKLQVLGVKDKDLRRHVLAAVRKAGYSGPTRKLESEGDSLAQPISKPLSTVQALVCPSALRSTTSQGCLLA